MARDNNRDRSYRVNRRGGQRDNHKRIYGSRPSQNNNDRRRINNSSNRPRPRNENNDDRRRRNIRKGGRPTRRNIRKEEKLNDEEMEIKLNNQLSNYFKDTKGFLKRRGEN